MNKYKGYDKISDYIPNCQKVFIIDRYLFNIEKIEFLGNVIYKNVSREVYYNEKNDELIELYFEIRDGDWKLCEYDRIQWFSYTILLFFSYYNRLFYKRWSK